MCRIWEGSRAVSIMPMWRVREGVLGLGLLFLRGYRVLWVLPGESPAELPSWSMVLVSVSVRGCPRLELELGVEFAPPAPPRGDGSTTRRVVQSDMLLSHKSSPDPGPQMLIQKRLHHPGRHIAPTLEEAARKRRNGIRMRRHQPGHDAREALFRLRIRDARRREGQERGEGVQVVRVDLGDVWVCGDDVGEGAEGLDAVG